jgi:hypothetical protein
MTSSSGSLAVANVPKAKENTRTAAILLVYNLQKQFHQQ